MDKQNLVKKHKLFRKVLGVFLYSLPFFLYIFFIKDSILEKIQAQDENLPQNLSEELNNRGIAPLLEQNKENPSGTEETSDKEKQTDTEQPISSPLENILNIIKENLTAKENPNEENKEDEQKNQINIFGKDGNFIIANFIEKYQNKDGNSCDYSTANNIQIQAGTNTIPEYLSGNTIYILGSGDYILDYMIKIGENCSVLIGNQSTLYTNQKEGATIKITTGANTIIANITIEGTPKHTQENQKIQEKNNYGIYIATNDNFIDNITFYNQSRFAIYQEKEKNTINNSKFFIKNPKDKQEKQKEIGLENGLEDASENSEFAIDNTPVILSKDKTETEKQAIWKRFEKVENKFRGKSSLDLSQSEGTINIPTILESLDESIKVDIPKDTIFIDKDGNPYQGIIIAPQKETEIGFSTTTGGTTLQSTNTIKVGSLDMGLQLTNSSGEKVQAIVEMKIDGYKAGDNIDIYSSEDGKTWQNIGVAEVKNNSGTTIVEIPTDHFSYISVGTSYGNYFKGTVTVEEEFKGFYITCEIDYGEIGFVSATITIQDESIFCSKSFSNTDDMYLQFRAIDDAMGYTYGPYTTFYYDNTAPGIPTIIAEPTYTLGTSNIIYTNAVLDAGVGVIQYEFCRNTTNTTVGCTSAGRSSSTQATFSSLTNGQLYYYFVRARDGLGNTSNRSSSTSSRQDATAPSPNTIIINNNNTHTNNPLTTLALSSTDTYGVVQMQFSCNNLTRSAPENYATTKSRNIISGSGCIAGDDIKYVYVKFKDTAGNRSTAVTDSIIYDTTLPTGSVIINNNNTHTNISGTTLVLSSTDTYGVVQMQFSCNNTTRSTPENYATSKSWNITNGSGCTAGDGTKYVYAKFKDTAGNRSTAVTDSIIYETTLPTGSIIINNNNTHTNTPLTTLALSSTDTYGVVQMQFSCNNTTRSTPENYATSKSWNITNGSGCTAGDGTKYVYAKFKDTAGNRSTTVTDSIIYDTTLPTGSVIINNNNTHTNISGTTLTLSSADTYGVVQMQFSCNNVTRSSPETYQTTKSRNIINGSGCIAGNGTRYVYVKFKDTAGNRSTAVTDTIVYETTLPTGSVIINNDDAATNSSYVGLSLEGIDTYGVAYMRFSCNRETRTPRQTYDTYQDFDLFYNDDEKVGCTEGDGDKSVFVQYIDQAGNIGDGYRDNILVDTTPPNFIFEGNNGPECSDGTLGIGDAYDNGIGLNDYPFSFSANGTKGRDIINYIDIPGQQPGTYNQTGWVRDALGNNSYQIATYTFDNVIPTASNYTGNNNIGNSAKTSSWISSANVQEGNCGTANISYNTIITQGSKGICAPTGTNNSSISYTPNPNKVGTDSCTIQIKDNENSTKNIIIGRSGIDTQLPIIELISPIGGPVFQEGETIQLNRSGNDGLGKGISGYTYEIIDANDISITIGTITGTEITISGLGVGDYTWKVIAIDKANNTKESDSGGFSIEAEQSIVWENDNFINNSFWELGPSNRDIIKALYGGGSGSTDKTAYTQNRSENNCNTSNMAVIHLSGSDIIPQTLSPNKIYTLSSGTYITTGYTYMDNCSAIIGKTGTVLIVSSIELSGTTQGLLTIADKKNTIIDNITTNGEDNGIGGNHTANYNSIFLSGSLNNTISNFITKDNAIGISIINSNFNTIKNSTIWNSSNGLIVNYSSNNTITNNKTFNNDIGIYILQNSDYNKINNNIGYNNNYGILITHNSTEIPNYNTLSNNLFFNNGYGLYLAYGTGNIFQNNNISNNQTGLFLGNYTQLKGNIFQNNKILNNTLGMDLQSTTGNFIYDKLELYNNDINSTGDGYLSLGSGDTYQSLGRSTGEIISGQSITLSDMANPKSISGNYLFGWNDSFANIRGKKTNFVSSDTISFGQNINKQKQPIIYSGSQLIASGEFTTNNYIGGTIPALSGHISGWNDSGVVTTFPIEIISQSATEYSITGDTLQTYTGSTNTPTTINLKEGTGTKNIITQIYQNNLITHFFDTTLIKKAPDIITPTVDKATITSGITGTTYNNEIFYKGTISLKANISDNEIIDPNSCEYSLTGIWYPASGTSTYCSITNIQPNTTINAQFRVKDIENNTGTGTSNTYLFDETAPSPANITSPNNQKPNYPGTTKIEWETSNDAISGLSGYILQISKDNFSTIYQQYIIDTNRYNATLLGSGSYQLRVISSDRANNISTGNTTEITLNTNLIEYYFGSGSKFTENREINDCDTGAMNIVYVYNYSGYGYFPYTSLAANTIYVLQEGKHITNSQINFNGNCIALIGENPFDGNKKTEMYASTQLTNTLYAYQKSKLIIDNISFEGGKNGFGGTHIYNVNNIKLESSLSSTIHNNNVINNSYGILLLGSRYITINKANINKNIYGIKVDLGGKNYIENSLLQKNTQGCYIVNSSENMLNNNIIINNSNQGIWLIGGPKTTINNSIIQNNSIGIQTDQSEKTYIYNTQITQNKSKGIKINLNGDIIAIKTTIIGNEGGDIYKDSRGQLKYYDTFKVNKIENDVFNIGGNEYLSLGINSGNRINDKTNSYNDKINIKNQSGLYLFNPINQTYGYNIGWDYISGTFFFGSSVPTKKQALKRGTSTLINHYSQFTENASVEFIASSTRKLTLQSSVDKQITTGDIQRNLTITGNNIFYQITGNITQITGGFLNLTQTIDIQLSGGEEKKRIIFEGWNNSSNGTTHQETITVSDTTPPTPPTNLNIKGVTLTTGIIIGRSASIDSGSEISGYIYQVSTSNDFSNIVYQGSNTDITATIEGLNPAVPHYFRVKAEDNVGFQSDRSSTLQFTISEEITNIIAEFYFGTGNTYTNTRDTQCDPNQIEVIKVSNYANGGTFPYSNLAANKIYLLEKGKHIIANTVVMSGACTAIAGEGTIDGELGEVELYSSNSLSYMINPIATKKIVDNLLIDGIGNGLGGTHSSNTYGVYFSAGGYNSIQNIQARNIFSASIYFINNTKNKIKNIPIINGGTYGIQTNNLTNSIFEDITVLNTLYPGIALDYNSNNNTLNNINIINNNQAASNGIYGISISSNSRYNSINNCNISNNGGFGIGIGSDDNIVNNCIVQGNEYYGIVITRTNNKLIDVTSTNNIGADIYATNAGNTLYNTNNTNKINKDYFTIGGNEYSGLNINPGELITNNTISWNTMTNITNKNNNQQLSPWLSPTRGRNLAWAPTDMNLEYSRGENIPTQKNIIMYSGTTITSDNKNLLSVNPDAFIGSDTQRIYRNIYINRIVTDSSDTKRIIGFDMGQQVYFEITGDIMKSFSGLIDFGEIGIITTPGEGTKNIIVQTRNDPLYKTHTHIKTYLDDTNPTPPITGNISRISQNNQNIEFFRNQAYDIGSEIKNYEYEIASDSNYLDIIYTDATTNNIASISGYTYPDIYIRVRALDKADKASNRLSFGGNITNIKNQNQNIINQYFNSPKYKFLQTSPCTDTENTRVYNLKSENTNDYSFGHLQSNSIYIVYDGVYNSSDSISFDRECTVLAQHSSGQKNGVSVINPTRTPASAQLFYTQKNIIEGITFDGQRTKEGGIHSKNNSAFMAILANYNNFLGLNFTNTTNGIYFWSTSTYNLIQDSSFYNNNYGIYFYGSSNNNVVNNSDFFNNIANGVHIRSAANNTFVNSTRTNNPTGIGLSAQTNKNTIINSTFSNNSYGINLIDGSASTYSIISDLAFINNTTDISASVDSYIRYYNTITGNTLGSNLIKGTGEFSSLGRSTGQINTIGIETPYNYLTNNKGNNWLFNWTSINRSNNTNRGSGNSLLKSYGKDSLKQKQTYRLNSANLTTYGELGIDRNNNYFIASKTTPTTAKVSIDDEITMSSDITRTLTLSGNGTFQYAISGNITTAPSGFFTDTVNIPVTLSSSTDGQKNIVIQIRTGNNEATHYQPFTFIDSAGPTTPLPIAPTQNQTISNNFVTANVNFEWSASTDAGIGMSGYVLEISTGSNFLTIAHRSTGYTTTKTVALKEGTYYWRVRAFDKATRYSLYSATWSFNVDTTFTQEYDKPSTPSIITPLNNYYFNTGFGISGSRTTSIDTGIGLSGYLYQLSTNENYTNIVFSGGTNQTGINFPILSDGKYYFRIAATDYLDNTSDYTGIVFGVDTIPSTIIFTGSTPENASTTTTNTATIQAEISEKNIKNINWNRNGISQSIYDSGLVLLLNFDNKLNLGETTGIIKDFSQYKNIGTGYYGVNRNQYGKIGGNYVFDGIDDYIRINNVQSITEDLTISVRIKQTYDGITRGIIVKGNEGTRQNNEYGIRGGAADNDHIFFIANEYIHGETGAITDKLIFNIPIEKKNQRVHLLATTSKQDNKLAVYLDGKLIAENQRTVENIGGNKNEPLYIGEGYETNLRSGAIDEVRIYNRALSSGEIKTLYETNLSKIDTDKWLFTTTKSCLTDQNYNYSLSILDKVGALTTTGRSFTVQLPNPTIGTPQSTLHFPAITNSLQDQTIEQNFSGNDNNFRVYDSKGYTGWYTTIQLSGDLTNAAGTRSIGKENISFKAGDNINLLEGNMSSGIALSSGINQYKALTGIFNYIIKNPTAECSSCIIGKYGNTPSLKVRIPALQKADIYNGTLIFTIYN